MLNGLRGFFIAFEGVDGSGTTTLSRMLAEYIVRTMRFKNVLLTREPSSSPYGKAIREMVDSGNLSSPEEQALFFANDRYYHWVNEIKPFLDRGWIVISDRYKLSSVVYQGLQMTNARKDSYQMDSDAWNEFIMHAKTIHGVNALSGDAHKVYFLRVSIGEAQRRKDSRDKQSSFDSDLKFQKNLIGAYSEWAKYDNFGSIGRSRGRVDMVNEQSAEESLFQIIGDLMTDESFMNFFNSHIRIMMSECRDDKFDFEVSTGKLNSCLLSMSNIIQKDINGSIKNGGSDD